jgi:adenosylmethionine-8-amino-7-oxononanoate aminotransferase
MPPYIINDAEIEQLGQVAQEALNAALAETP